MDNELATTAPTLTKQADRKTRVQVIEEASRFDIAAPVSEEEFDTALDYVAQVLLFDTRWEEKVASKPYSKANIMVLGSLPMICSGTACVYSSVCPILKAMTTNSQRMKLVGTKCRVEKEKALEAFSSWIHELDIAPEDTTDLLNLSLMIRNVITLHRIDWTIAMNGMYEQKVGGIVQKTGQVFYNKELSQLHKLAQDITKQQQSLHSQLVASRRDRVNLAASTGKSMSVLQKLMTQRLEAKQAAENVTEAEYTEDDEPKGIGSEYNSTTSIPIGLDKDYMHTEADKKSLNRLFINKEKRSVN